VRGEGIDIARSHFIDGETAGQIAARRDLGEKTVRNRLTSIKQTLLADLKEDTC
jgi:DNA-binding NarL/FixJ family response regulator